MASCAFFLTRVRMHKRACERIRRQKRAGPWKGSESQSEDYKKKQTSPCVPKVSIVASQNLMFLS